MDALVQHFLFVIRDIQSNFLSVTLWARTWTLVESQIVQSFRVLLRIKAYLQLENHSRKSENDMIYAMSFKCLLSDMMF